LVDLAEYAVSLLRAGRLDDAESIAGELAELSAAHEAESLPFFPTYVQALVAGATARGDAGALVAAARARLETYLAALDPEGRDEMLASTFVRPLLALAAS
jgi:hypothetical protein